ncbi:MAG: diguanylate cyclase [Burkholderiales bacterium]|nr:diguanylate cyclase [Burkholderiales bacterium]
MSGVDARAASAIARLHPLPSPRGVALRIMQRADDENVGIEEIAHIVRADPALSGLLIRAANAPALGAGRAVGSVGEAIQRLGLSAVRQMVLGFSLVSDYSRGPCKSFEYQAFWTDSLLRGLAAQALAARTRLIAPGDAFSCGLLAEVGRLGFSTAQPEAYAQVIAVCGARGERLREIERESFALDHGELTVAMAQTWALPAWMSRALQGYYGPWEEASDGATSGERLAQLLRLAGAIATGAMASPEPLPQEAARALRVGVLLDLDEEALRSIAVETAQQAAEWAQLLSLPVPAMPRETPAACAEAGGAPPSGEHRTPLRILIVEDQPVERALLKKVLEEEGHTVSAAENGRAALVELTRFPPQLLITDWTMPEMGGADLCRILRKTRFGARLHVIFLTSRGDEDEAVAAFKVGANDLVAKPYSPRALLARVYAAARSILQQEEIARDRDAMRQVAVELAVSNRRLEDAALTDDLTGLPNRRSALARLEQECAAARRRGTALACLLIDVDHFKRVNDTCGHETGDAVLRHIARTMSAVSRKQDSVCRVGGEEFAAILPDTGWSEAVILAERLRKAIAAAPFRTTSGRELSLTASLGVAADEACEANASELMGRADEALYAAKHEGRNCVRPLLPGVPRPSAASASRSPLR